MPLVYLPYLVGFFVGRALNMPLYWFVVFMRLAGFALYIAVSFWCIRTIPIAKWPLATVALLPATISTVATVSADTVTIALAFLFITFFLSFLEKPDQSRGRWVAFGVVCMLFPIAKLAYSPLIGLLFALPLFQHELRTRSALAALCSFFVASLAVLFCWWLVIKGINTGAMWKVGINVHDQLSNVLHHPLGFLKMFLFSIPFQDVLQVVNMGVQGRFSDAWYTDFGWLGVVLICITAQLHDLRREASYGAAKRKVVPLTACFVLVSLTSMFLVYLALYLTFSVPGCDVFEGIQDRYFIPITLLILLPVSILSIPARDMSLAVGKQEGVAGDARLETKGLTFSSRDQRLMTVGALVFALAASFAYLVILFTSVF